nr:MAG TPA: hypothetical protein [Caudoviricetes sp.]
MQGLEGGPRHGVGDTARKEDRDGAAPALLNVFGFEHRS